MKIYVDVNDYEVYTEKNIDEAIIRKIKDDNYEGLLYEGLLSYIEDNFTGSEIFDMLSPNSRSIIFEHLKESVLNDEFYESEIDDPSPCDKCPHKK